MGLLPTNLIHNQSHLLSIVSQRQEAISDNIANMHTPNYHRKDVNFSSLLNSGISSQTEAKMIDKFGPSPISSSSGGGENLSVEDELAIMQQNYLYYAVATRELSSTITQIKTALNVSASG